MSRLIPTITSKNKATPDQVQSRVHSPNPARIRFLTDLLSKMVENKVTFASVMKLDKKKLKQLAEAGFTKLKYGRADEARKIFEVLSFVDHKNAFYHLALGSAYQKLKKDLDAAYQYGECLRYDPQNTNALVNRGEIFLKHKNFKKAAEDFRAAILLDEAGKDVFANRARSLVIAIKRSLSAKKGEIPTIESKGKKRARKRVNPSILLGKKKK